MMSNKPQNVVRHEHFHAYTDEERNTDERLEIKRFDACELTNGTCGVWDVELDVWDPCSDFATARAVAAGGAAAIRALERGNDR